MNYSKFQNVIVLNPLKSLKKVVFTEFNFAFI